VIKSVNVSNIDRDSGTRNGKLAYHRHHLVTDIGGYHAVCCS
jgi:hypothetical protein